MLIRRLAFFGACSSATVLALAASLGGGCTFDAAPAAADTGFVEDDVGQDTPPVNLPISVYAGGKDIEPDLSCKGHPREAGPPNDAAWDAADDATAPLGQLLDTQIDMLSFGSGGSDKLPNAAFDVYYGNAISGRTPDITGVTDDKGFTHVMLPAGDNIAYVVHAVTNSDPRKALHAFYEFDILIPRSGGGVATDISGMTEDTFNNLQLAAIGHAGYVPPPGTGIFAARVLDCQRRFIRNASVDLVDVDTGVNLPFVTKCDSGGLCRLYLSDSELPAPSIRVTSRSGLVSMVNVPVTSATKRLQVVAKGSFGGDPTLAVVGKRDLEIADGAINVFYVLPN